MERDCLYERLDDSCVSQMVNETIMDPLVTLSRTTYKMSENCQPEFNCTTTTTTTTTTTLRKLSVTRLIGLPPYTPVAQKITDLRLVIANSGKIGTFLYS